jgi:GTP-dependent phosphoenolpyruvate carboxykinase
MQNISKFYDEFGDRLPEELTKELKATEERLKK